MNSKQILSRLTVATLGLGFALSASASTPSFAAQQSFSTGSYPYAIASADLNGSGKQDLITANWTDGTVSVLMNTASTGASTPSYAPQQTFDVGTGPTFVTTADLNGDGKPDLIVLSRNSATMTVLLNTTANGASQASFGPAQTFAVGNFAQTVAVADVNGDGSPDLIVANYGDYTISVLLNTTAANDTVASFATQQTIFVNGGPYALQAVDFNGDGLPDVVVTEFDSAMVSVLINTTVPGPASTTTVSFAAQEDFPVGSFPTSVAAVDLNGDTLPDLAVSNEGDNTVSVLFNNTVLPLVNPPSFADQQVIAVGNAPQELVAADIDHDGTLGLVVANYSDNTIMVLQNTTGLLGTTFSYNQQTFAVGSEPYALTTTNANADGKVDIAALNQMDNTVSVLLNTTP